LGREIQGVLFISGIPGAGKTTVARIIAQRLSRSAHIESDAIQDLVISGRKHPNEEPREESDRQLMLRERNVAALIDNFVADGFGVIVDDVIAYRARLERYLALIASRPVYLVILAPPLDVSLARDMARSGKTVGHFWSHLDQVIRREMSGLGLWIDSSEMTAEETAGEALKNVIEHGLIAG
jgi:chloramphenicol 3-O-phosphotransferase